MPLQTPPDGMLAAHANVLLVPTVLGGTVQFPAQRNSTNIMHGVDGPQDDRYGITCLPKGQRHSANHPYMPKHLRCSLVSD